jgi:hypothetical protein
MVLILHKHQKCDPGRLSLESKLNQEGRGEWDYPNKTRFRNRSFSHSTGGLLSCQDRKPANADPTNVSKKLASKEALGETLACAQKLLTALQEKNWDRSSVDPSLFRAPAQDFHEDVNQRGPSILPLPPERLTIQTVRKSHSIRPCLFDAMFARGTARKELYLP